MREIVDFQAAREKAIAQTRNTLESTLQQRYDALLAQQSNATGQAYEAINHELNTIGPVLDALRNSTLGSVRDLETAIQSAQAIFCYNKRKCSTPLRKKISVLSHDALKQQCNHVPDFSGQSSIFE